MDGSKCENPVGLEVVCVLTPVHLAFKWTYLHQQESQLSL